MELSSGGWAPSGTGFPQKMSVLGTHLDQCTSWHCCERLCSASVNFFFFWKLLMCLPISWWVIYESTWPKRTEWSAVFDQKWHDSFLTHPISPEQFFLFLRMKKVLRGTCFADVEEVIQKIAGTLKGIKLDKFKNCFEQWKKISW